MSAAPVENNSPPTSFHDVISSKHAKFQPAPNRYILYVSYACPWANRCLMVLRLKKLDDIVQIVVLDPESVTDGEEATGWVFKPEHGIDPVMQASNIRQLYIDCCPNYAGYFTVPVLYDSKTKIIVNNESSEIIRIFNSGFNDIGASKLDLYPLTLRHEIDDILNPWIMEKVNSGVYKTGRAKTQEDYETHCKALFEALDKVESILNKHRFLAGRLFTEADVRLFTTLIRMPTLYECHFKCNLKTLRDSSDYPKIFKWMKTIYQMPGIAETINQDHVKRHFYKTQKSINPNGVIPLYDGPDLSQPKCPTCKSDFSWFN